MYSGVVDLVVGWFVFGIVKTWVSQIWLDFGFAVGIGWFGLTLVGFGFDAVIVVCLGLGCLLLISVVFCCFGLLGGWVWWVGWLLALQVFGCLVAWFIVMFLVLCGCGGVCGLLVASFVGLWC